MVENVKGLTTELELDALRDSERAKQTEVRVEE
jgi:hypothetical protein